LSLFAAPSRLRQLSLYGSKGMVSQCKCQRMQARRTREIRLERMFGNVPVHTRSTHLRGIVCANPSFHCMSPGSVSRYSSPCYPLRSILTRRPAPGILLFRISRTREFSRRICLTDGVTILCRRLSKTNNSVGNSREFCAKFAQMRGTCCAPQAVLSRNDSVEP
jgi:hypothetical protein